ncbi:IQCJ-SCHIP1 readthrough transcript protein-like [Mytilus californianus]|uniref:IQCJ-SCHIP1 readthrough transcript protein-like n=1 Tax=Mytilus californianus TaxID=6549 RepID=UPI002247D32C|nr:IQCJ-SCHIP1 readthrough transcript protein-like [Mytilus californianus]
MNTAIKEQGEMSYPRLNTESDTTLEKPDLEQLRHDRLERNIEVMKAFNPAITKALFPGEKKEENCLEHCATCIQRHFRGYQGRKKYVELLYQQFSQQEQERFEKIMRQTEEGELLVENHQLEVLLDDNTTTRRNRARKYISHVITIQRAWRRYCNAKDKKQIVDSEEKDGDSEKSVMKVTHSNEPLLDKILSDKFSRESTPDDRVARSSLSPCRNILLNKLKSDTDTDSVSSDYSVEISAPLREFSDIHIYDKNELTDSSVSTGKLERRVRETEEDFSRRVRKTNLLSIAQEFAELKKVNADALPFDLHKSQNLVEETSSSECSSATSSKNPSEMNTPSEVRSNPFQDVSATSETKTKDLNSNSIKEMLMNERKNKSSPNQSPKRSAVNGQLKQTNDIDGQDDFDVYNIETAIPQMDWDTLEQQLQQAAEFERRKKESQKNDREEIRRKLAMGPVEDDFESEMFKKPGFSSKLQTGMNLQICFMNESQGDKEETSVSLPDVVPVISETKSDVKSTVDNKGTINDGEEDFFKKQARLQQEAKIALAQASTMAHMQVEVEKQKKKQSPVADIIGLPFSNHHRYGKSVYEMNVGQLQTLVNDLHTQIENLNEDLVKLLMERDDLHMMQDSKLVDIEDLTRRAEEKAYRINNKQQKEKL